MAQDGYVFSFPDGRYLMGYGDGVEQTTTDLQSAYVFESFPDEPEVLQGLTLRGITVHHVVKVWVLAP